MHPLLALRGCVAVNFYRALMYRALDAAEAA